MGFDETRGPRTLNERAGVTPSTDGQGLPLDSNARSALEKILILIHMQTGHDFSLYKKSAVYRRIERRMSLHRIDRIVAYVRFLQENPKETELLFKELLIGVTSFFRDPAAWDGLREKVIPALLAAHPNGGVFRAWTPGCSTGEEAYTLAMVFKEAVEKINPAGNYSLQIFATDLNHDAIDKARVGLYPATIAADVSAKHLRRFFVQEGCGYRVGKEIREMVIFSPKNVIIDPPFTKIDIVICRNLFIYLAPELQKILLLRFHYSLNPGGILFLGGAETIGDFTNHFELLNGKTRIYRRLDATGDAKSAEFPAPSPPALFWIPVKHPMDEPIPNLQGLMEPFLPATGGTPLSTLTNDKGDILYIQGETGKYLEPPAGKANWNIFAMAREGYSSKLATAFRKALRQKKAVILSGLHLKNHFGTETLDISLQRITEPEALRGMVLTIFSDLPAPPESVEPGKFSAAPSTSIRAAQFQHRHKLQHTLEQRITLQEDIRSMNEELQALMNDFSTLNSGIPGHKQVEEKHRMNIGRYHTFFMKCPTTFCLFEIGHTPIDKTLSTDEQVELLYGCATIRGCNRTLAKYHGLSNSEEMIGLKIGQIFPRLAQQNVSCLRGFIENGYSIAGAETKEACSDGRVRYFSNSLIGCVETGSLTKILGAKQDISWLKRAAGGRGL